MEIKISKMIPLLLVIVVLLVWWSVKSLIPKGPDDGEILSAYTELDSKNITEKITHFNDNFDTLSLEEAGSMNESENDNWWLNSGGQISNTNGISSTIQGDLPFYNRWRMAYSISNPTDTDKGFRPQNIFRLVTKSRWKNFTQQVYFRVNNNNLSRSTNRNESNGLLLFNRYYNGQNLYYVGLRVDGAVVIKKKLNGKYYTMVYQKYFPGEYHRETSPNLIPKNVWIGIKSEVSNLPNGDIKIKMYLDSGRLGSWTYITEIIDSPNKFGDKLISEEGYAGIRTDFMDVEFSDYKIEELQ